MELLLAFEAHSWREWALGASQACVPLIFSLLYLVQLSFLRDQLQSGSKSGSLSKSARLSFVSSPEEDEAKYTDSLNS